MEDEASTSLDGKVLGNLRVVDLKQELEKRGLSKSGSKKDLVKRLKQQLEFEKLCEERKSSGDFDRKLELDAAIEQNEFVQQYLAQQKKRYAERKEAEKRLELEATLEKNDEGKEPDSSDKQMTIEKNQVSDDDDDDDEEEEEEEEEDDDDDDEVEEVDEKISQVCEPSKREQKEITGDENMQITEASATDERPTNSSETEDEEPICTSPPVASEIVGIGQKSPQPCNTKEAEESQTTCSVLDIAQNSEVIRDIIPQSSPKSEDGEAETPKKSEKALESEGNDYENVSVPVVSDSVKEQTDCIHENADHSDAKKSEIFTDDLNAAKDKEEITSNNAVQDISEQTECVEPQSNILDAAEEDNRSLSSHGPFGGNSSPENLCKQDPLETMESSECSSVPYSLSDIQLPESPGHHLKCKELNEEKCSKTDPIPEISGDQNLSSHIKIQSNGVATVDTVNSSNEEVVSESETKESINVVDSPKKSFQREESENNRQIDESSDLESDKNDSQHKKKSFNNEEASSNITVDSAEENAPNDAVSKDKKSPHQMDESDNGKSSDSEKYKSSLLDSRQKSHGKHRKRNRHSRSSSSSSSHSSDSSPKRRHSKKSVVSMKNKDFVENDESNQMSEKSLDDKREKLKNEDSIIESSSSLSSKKRLKIKRDNVPIEVNAASVESMESTSSRSIDNITSSTSHPVSEKLSKQESTEVKLSFSELSYAPRKVSLANRKLNRKSSEDKSNEPKLKRNKWESFAAAQKVSQTISISTDSLKTWFPDFKLMSEPSSSMELEPEEHSLPAADEKSMSLLNIDVSNINDSGIKQESASQMDIEDSVSLEPNFEDSSEQGPVSKILFIQNLVRPFTLNQLKELLKQNGKIVEEYFWIDKIKSKCFVMYETEKEAIKARNALNNTRWPSSNPKILSVDYSNEEEMEQHKKGNDPQPKPLIEPPVIPEIPEVIETRVSHTVDEHKRKDRDRRKERERSKPLPPVREWDKDKVMQDSPEREHIPKEEKSRSSDKKEKKESKKRPNEDTPAKLLDDLFQKTKNPPCIYWLPLTEEQAKQKEEAKKMRKLEREKRNQHIKEQEEAERRSKRARSSRRSREKENRKSSTRSRSPVTRRR